MMTDLDKEIFAKIEECVRIGFKIAKDSAIAYSERGDGWGDYNRIDWRVSTKKLEEKIADMKKAALGQEAA